MPELSKTYTPNEVESDIYRRWEKSGYFNPDNLPNAKKRKPFVISMPPSNITGELHVGHMLGFTIQDILIRFQRMRGRAALWVPGTDHAAIATQVVVERELRKEGIDRHQLGREAFLKRVWKWKEQYGNTIIQQTKRMGASADWSRLHFTMDQDLTKAVNVAFKKLYDDGLIYRGERIVNWCSACQTAISDLEVDHEESPGKLWHLRYPLSDGSGFIVVATTRPETMLGDTAVAVNPKDERYQALVGQMVTLPLVRRQIPIVADARIDSEFGTGAVKVTPAHDPLDFDLGQTHSLQFITVIGFDGRMTASAGEGFVGLTVDEARNKALEDLRSQELVEKEEDYIHSLALCSRSKTVIEPLLSLQWFVRTKPLAAKAIRAVRSGKIKILPKRFEKTYFQWMENIRDWNISRQIWWGHRLPVWYKTVKGKEVVKVSEKRPGPGWKQDTDTLDTWFSSGLWTFSTLGWPRTTSDLRRFHPTDVMETAWDIIFFWVARMVMFSEYLLKEVPFTTVYLHGLILDKNGKKMSKSKGTGVDPIPMADKYGMDALRMSLIIGNAPGQDFRLSEKKIEGFRNFSNKIWNIARFILNHPRPAGRPKPESIADHWILARTQETVRAVTAALDTYDLSSAGQRLYDLVWHDLADWYLEATKVRPNIAVLYAVFETVLKLLHPFMPFITEELWSKFGQRPLLMIESWPTVSPRSIDSEMVASFEAMRQTIGALRNFKIHAALPSGAPCHYVATGASRDAELLRSLSGVVVQPVPRLMVNGGYHDVLLGHTRFQVERQYADRYEAWRQKERASLEQYVSGLERKLANEQFVQHAPSELVAQEREKLVAAKTRLLEL